MSAVYYTVNEGGAGLIRAPDQLIKHLAESSCLGEIMRPVKGFGKKL